MLQSLEWPFLYSVITEVIVVVFGNESWGGFCIWQLILGGRCIHQLILGSRCIRQLTLGCHCIRQ